MGCHKSGTGVDNDFPRFLCFSFSVCAVAAMAKEIVININGESRRVVLFGSWVALVTSIVV